jgi:hypothetical protein
VAFFLTYHSPHPQKQDPTPMVRRDKSRLYHGRVNNMAGSIPPPKTESPHLWLDTINRVSTMARCTIRQGPSHPTPKNRIPTPMVETRFIASGPCHFPENPERIRHTMAPSACLIRSPASPVAARRDKSRLYHGGPYKMAGTIPFHPQKQGPHTYGRDAIHRVWPLSFP